MVLNCGDIYRVDHGDPCVGTKRGDVVTKSPTQAPGSGANSNKAPMMGAALFGTLVVGLLLLDAVGS
jgi:hypothetical protein